MQIEHPKLRVHCFEMPIEFPKGYGVSKVMAIQHAPLDQVVWLDCDTFPTRDLEYLFEDPEFARTGAMFWPDVEGHYHVERATGEGQLFDNAGVDQALFPCVAALGPRAAPVAAAVGLARSQAAAAPRRERGVC